MLLENLKENLVMEQKVVKSCKNCKFSEDVGDGMVRCSVGDYLLQLKGEIISLSEFRLPKDFGCIKFKKHEEL